jgi:hypothetical protein
MSGFASTGEGDRLPKCNEAESGLLLLRLAPLAFGGSDAQVTPERRSVGYMSNGQLTWLAPFI